MNDFKTIRVFFCMSFLFLIMIPLFCINLRPGGRTAYENRQLAESPAIYDKKGNLNTNFITDFEKWFCDHIGLRDYMVQIDGVMQYYISNRIEKQPLGPNGELAHIHELGDFQHNNLMSNEELGNLCKSIKVISDYIQSTGSQFYFMQCWDKHSIYPEYFPDTINRNGDISKAEQVEDYLEEKTDIHVVRIKDALISAKKEYNVYGKWTDPWHWNPRGSVIAYYELMKNINYYSKKKYEMVNDSEYEIQYKDKGGTYYGLIHKEELVETFKFKNPTYLKYDESLTYCSQIPSLAFSRFSPLIYINYAVNNHDTLLVLGDSYIWMSAIFEMLKSTFHKVVFYNIRVLGNDNALPSIIEAYHPSITLFELAERGKNSVFSQIINTSEKLNGLSLSSNTKISLCKGNNDTSQYVLSGLAKPEKTGAWTNDNEFTMLVQFPFDTNGNTIHSHINLNRIYGDCQRIRITVNGINVFSGEVNKGQDIDFNFENPRTFATIKIYFLDAISPFELGKSGDKRRLALNIKDVVFNW